MSILKHPEKSITFQMRDELVFVEPYGKDCIRVRATRNNTVSDQGWTLLPPKEDDATITQINNDCICLENGIMKAEVCRVWGGYRIHFYKNGKRILNPETVELMGTNHLKDRQLDDFFQLRPGYGYGLGVRTHIDKSKSGSLSPIGEFGWDGAAGAFSLVDTRNKLSLTYFQHIHAWDVGIQSEIRNALYQCIEV